MARRKFSPKSTTKSHYDSHQGLATDKPVAVYYRQSTEAQVGNNSTAIQTIDMVAELKRRGWHPDDIILIDTDAGISGMTKIDERPGMSRLFELITDGVIGTVACQDEDRLFRDFTQIQVNIFIEACRMAKVQVLTPFFTYDFSHPAQGDFHIRQFRFKSEMAAEYIKSYILGRLTPARTRLALQGKWVGSATPAGYMVDMRQYLSDGNENPNWRKYVPFEPLAEIVREHFRLFLENGGNVRKTMRVIRKRGLSFPDCPVPKGFKTNSQLRRREGGFYLNRTNMVAFLTNPVYVGHWIHQGEIVVWDNHEPIILLETFTRAFNYLSKYTLTGEKNPDYTPATRYVRKEVEEERKAERPLLIGLIQSEVNGTMYRAHIAYENRNQCYLYGMHENGRYGAQIVWSRRAAWIDEAVVSHFLKRMTATYKPEVWKQTIESSDETIAQERKIKKAQLTNLLEAKKNLIHSLERLSSLDMIEQIEQRYIDMEKEEARLKEDLEILDDEEAQKVSLKEAYEMFGQAIEKWDEMNQDEKRNLLQLFIYRIEATDYDRSGRMCLIVNWRDGKQTKINIKHKPHADNFSYDDIQKLLKMYDDKAGQLEIAAEFPTLKWYQIFNEIKRHRDKIRFTPIYMRKMETFEEYEEHGGRKGMATPSLWRDEEIEQLCAMVNDGSTQIEIMKEFPYRRWIRLQDRIKELFGKGTRIPRGEESISQRLSYIEYIQQNETVGSADTDTKSATETNTIESDSGSENEDCYS